MRSEKLVRNTLSTLLTPHSALLIAIAILLPHPSLAHPTGTSKLDLFIAGDTLEALVDANRDDLFNSVRVDRRPKLDQEELRILNERIAQYFQTRLTVEFDNHPAAMGRVLSWRKSGRDTQRMMDSAELYDTTLVLRLGWPIPAGARQFALQARLFAELEVQAICHARVYYHDTLIRERWLGMDQKLEQPLAPDSLAARLLAVAAGPGQAPAAPPEEENVFKRFFLHGIIHIVPLGWDHILFVLGLFFFSTYMRPLLLQVTAFTIAHSITLGLSVLGVFSLPSRVVEPLIALSIAVVAIENIFFRKLRPSRWLIVFGFGLVHGLGFAGALRELGLPEGQFLKTLIAFNLGVEGGQLIVIGLATAATVWFWKKPWYHRYVVVPISAGIALAGLTAAILRVIS